MTITNNSAKYAVSLDYEVREADNSINCKTAYEVFDNMQDAVNYAIDFIANNPDANIRLTNEHFNGSQISVYGDSPTKHYNLTDADINAVRNVEVNEADVEDYVVTAEAQDVATYSEIRNANTASGNYSETIYTDVRNGRKIFESVTYKNHSIVRVEAPRYGLTLDITFRGNRVFKHNGRRIAAKAVAEIYMNRERADEQYKIFSAIFTPHHFGLQNRQRAMFTVNVHTTFANGTAHNFYGEFENYSEVEPFVQEVKTLADELNIPVEVSTEARYNKYPQATAWVDPHQYGEPGNLEQPRDISIYCNKPATESTTPMTVNDEDKIFTFEVGKTYYGDDFDGVWTTDGKVIIHTLTVISRTAKTLTAVDETGNTVTKKIVLGYSGTLESVNVLGVNDITVQTVKISANHEYTPAIAAVSTEHYLNWMNAVENIELGLPIPDEPPTDEPPADDFKAKLTALKAKAADAHNAEQAAQRLLDEAEAAYKKAEDSHRDAYMDAHNADVAIKKFLADKAKELRDNLLDDDIFNGKIAIIAQGGKRFDKPDLGQIWIDFTPEQKFLINICTKYFAIYDTPAQVTAAIARLKDAIANGATEFKFPTIGELNKPTTANEWRTVRTKTNPRNVNLTVQNKARTNA